MSEENRNIVDSAIAAATAMTQSMSGAHVALIPGGYKLADLEKFMDAPQRKRGHVQIHTVDSFVQYVNRHKTNCTQIYARAQPLPTFVAVIDDHYASDGSIEGGANFGAHRATYAPPLSHEWQTWVSNSGKKLSQEDFALFLEQNVLDVLDPAAGAFLDIARTLQATTGAKFRSGLNLSNGSVQITYEEEVNGTAGVEGKTLIPEEFTLGIPVMQGGPRFRVVAKFRYSIKQGVLNLSYDLIRTHKVLEAAVDEMVKIIQSTDKPVTEPDVTEEGTGEVTPGKTPPAGTGIAVIFGVPSAESSALRS